MLKTTSPSASRPAPTEYPRKTVPSSSARKAFFSLFSFQVLEEDLEVVAGLEGEDWGVLAEASLEEADFQEVGKNG